METLNNVSSEMDILEDIAAKKINEFAPVIAYVAFVVICGFLGNIVTVAYYGFKIQRNNTTVFICALAVVDAITCLVTSDEIIELCYAVTFTSRVGCRLMYFLNHTCVSASILILFFIGVDRFRKVCFPFSWQFSITTTKRCIFGIIIFAITLSARDFVILDIVRVPIQNGTVRAFYCTHTNDANLKPVVKAFQMVDATIVVCVIIILVIMYSMMVRQIFVKHKAVTKASQKPEGESTVSSQGMTGNTNLALEHACHMESSSGGQCATDIKDDVSYCPPTTDSTGHSLHRPLSLPATDCTSDFVQNKDPPSEQNESSFVDSGIGYSGNQQLVDKTASKKSDTRNHPRPLPPKNTQNNVTVSSRIERQITLMMAAISSGFILSFVPYFVVNLAVKLTSDTSESELSVGIQVALRSYLLNSAINPYIICLFNSGYRRFVVQNINNYCRRR